MSSSTGAAENPSGPRHQAGDLSSGFAGMANHWGLLLALGVLMAGLGVVMLAWPGATLVVLAVTFAFSLFVSGIYSLVAAFAPDLEGGARALHVVVGALSVLAGLLCLRRPLQTLVILGLMIGAWWLVTGVTGGVGALFGGSQPGRWWKFTTALLSVAAGIFVLLQPAISLLALKFVLALWLIAYGAIAIVGAVLLRIKRRSLVAAPTPPPQQPEGLVPA